ncbi:hypothetical protein KDW50_32435 [Burkholderia ambifaria]|jgi:hypothetical protein|nr:hypothetical protein [Burkholderia ambifaria]
MAEGRMTQVESFGFERIPGASRYARPIDPFRRLKYGFHVGARQLSRAGRAVVCEPAGPVRRAARQPRGRARSQRAGSLAVGGLLYFVLLTVYPEAEGVYGPRGRFLVGGVGAPVIQPNGY